MHLGEAGNRILFIWHDSLLPCMSIQIALLSGHVIKLADPGLAPRVHEVNHWSATLASLHTRSMERVQEGGQMVLHSVVPSAVSGSPLGGYGMLGFV